MERNNREFDVIVWGATGFTGRLVAQYLAQNAPYDIKWAIGGRAAAKLSEIKKNLIKLNNRLEKDLEIVTGLIDTPPP